MSSQSLRLHSHELPLARCTYKTADGYQKAQRGVRMESAGLGFCFFHECPHLDVVLSLQQPSLQLLSEVTTCSNSAKVGSRRRRQATTPARTKALRSRKSAEVSAVGGFQSHLCAHPRRDQPRQRGVARGRIGRRSRRSVSYTLNLLPAAALPPVGIEPGVPVPRVWRN